MHSFCKPAITTQHPKKKNYFITGTEKVKPTAKRTVLLLNSDT